MGLRIVMIKRPKGPEEKRNRVRKILVFMSTLSNTQRLTRIYYVQFADAYIRLL